MGGNASMRSKGCQALACLAEGEEIEPCRAQSGLRERADRA
jgi:hypothetical protein